MKPTDRTHLPSYGPIRVWVYRTLYGWVARHQGPQLDGGMVFETLEEANAHAEQSFGQMIPEHKCGNRCTTGDPPPTS